MILLDIEEAVNKIGEKGRKRGKENMGKERYKTKRTLHKKQIC